MNANGRASVDLPLKHEVDRVVGAAMEALNAIGHGLHEKPHENSLVAELGLVGIPVRQQDRYPVIYKGAPVHE